MTLESFYVPVPWDLCWKDILATGLDWLKNMDQKDSRLTYPLERTESNNMSSQKIYIKYIKLVSTTVI